MLFVYFHDDNSSFLTVITSGPYEEVAHSVDPNDFDPDQTQRKLN